MGAGMCEKIKCTYCPAILFVPEGIRDVRRYAYLHGWVMLSQAGDVCPRCAGVNYGGG